MQTVKSATTNSVNFHASKRNHSERMNSNLNNHPTLLAMRMIKKRKRTRATFRHSMQVKVKLKRWKMMMNTKKNKKRNLTTHLK